jgi:hypothetical protein
MNASQTTEKMFTTPESYRTNPGLSSEGRSFQNMVSLMDAVPLGSPLTAFDWKLLGSDAEYDAQSAFLQDLADKI